MSTSQAKTKQPPKTRWKKTQQTQQVNPISMYPPMDNTQEFQQPTFMRNLVDTSSFENDMCNLGFPPNASPSYGQVQLVPPDFTPIFLPMPLGYGSVPTTPQN